jgi:DNA-binding PadR family transcriptional regulator
MSTMLDTFDLLVLLTTLRLGDEAYGVSIAEAVANARGRGVSMASVYVAIERLEERGLVVSALGEPTAARGGRAKRYVRVTAAGIQAIKSTQRVLNDLWSNVPSLKGRAR